MSVAGELDALPGGMNGKNGLLKQLGVQGPLVGVLIWAVVTLTGALKDKDAKLTQVLEQGARTNVELVTTLQALRSELIELRREVRGGRGALRGDAP